MFPDWPAGGLLKCLSIQPPVRPLLAGQLDADIKRLIAKAPKGSMLGIFHEAEGQHYPGVDAPTMRAMHQRMLSLTRGSNVAYGSFSCGAMAANVAWTISGLDFYGLDIYDAVDFSIGFAGMMNRFLANVTNVQKNPVIAVTECNSHIPSRRPYAFSALYGWLRRHHYAGTGFGPDRASCLLTYWNPGGGLSGPWLPGDTATINALEQVIADASGTVTE